MKKGLSIKRNHSKHNWHMKMLMKAIVGLYAKYREPMEFVEVHNDRAFVYRLRTEGVEND